MASNGVNKPLVGILMGSDSDLPVMQEAVKVLEELGIASEVHTLSAHRTPEAVVEYVKVSEAGGYKVFICGAGGAGRIWRASWLHTRHFPSSACRLRAKLWQSREWTRSSRRYKCRRGFPLRPSV